MENMNLKQLKQIAKDYGIKRYSQLNKKELIECIGQMESPGIFIYQKFPYKKLNQPINPVLKKLNVEHMRTLAKECGIKKYYHMNRNELIYELNDMEIDPDKFFNIIDNVITASKKYECIHGCFKYQCKKCQGSQICEHNKRRTRCKECGGGSICEHKRQKTNCKLCKVVKICEHNKMTGYCKECC